MRHKPSCNILVPDPDTPVGECDCNAKNPFVSDKQREIMRGLTKITAKELDLFKKEEKE